MRAIPAKLREKMAKNPYYHKCCLKDETCNGRIEWHHHLRFAGRQINDEFSILPICHAHHEKAREKETADKLSLIAFSRATEEDFNKYPKAKERWKQEFKYLTKKYGKK